MKLAAFNTLMGARRFAGRTREALRMVLVQGESGNYAAKTLGINPSTVSRALDEVTTKGACPHCGAEVRTIRHLNTRGAGEQ